MMFWNETAEQCNQTMCLWYKKKKKKGHAKLPNNRFRCWWINLERIRLCIALIDSLMQYQPPTPPLLNMVLFSFPLDALMCLFSVQNLALVKVFQRCHHQNYRQRRYFSFHVPFPFLCSAVFARGPGSVVVCLRLHPFVLKPAEDGLMSLSPICADVACFFSTVPASAFPNGGHLPLYQPRSEQIAQCLYGEHTEGLRGRSLQPSAEGY